MNQKGRRPVSYASVALDIPTRAIDAAYDYLVPDGLAATATVGATVLVPFSGRDVVGYVMDVHEEPPAGVAPGRVRPVTQVLAEPAFDGAAARVARWMAAEYACPLCEAVRPFLAPGQKVRVTRASADAPWQLVSEKAGPVDERWVGLAPTANDYAPGQRASRQRAVLEALREGPQRVAELSATIPGAASAVTALAKRGVVEVFSRRSVRGSQATSLSSAAAPRPERLTAGQAEALAAIDAAREEAAGGVVLVDGVTGSGKTEVYLDAIERALAGGRGAIVLVPEISLTAQTVGRFRSRFGEDVAVLHSRLSTGERFDQWDLVRRGQAHVVVGARSALFAPLADPGLIIIDEEHEASYKQDSSPRYHAREVAARMAAERGCALVLGSATPSLESLARCRAGHFLGRPWTRVSMPERPAGARPSQGDHRGHGRAVPRRPPRGLLGASGPRARGRLRASREGRAAPQPPRVCQLPHVPRVRVRAGVPALQLRPHLPRAHPLAHVPHLWSRLAGACLPGPVHLLPQLRQSLHGRLRRGHPAR